MTLLSVKQPYLRTTDTKTTLPSVKRADLRTGVCYVRRLCLRFLSAADHSVLLAEEVYDWIDCLREDLAEVDLVA